MAISFVVCHSASVQRTLHLRAKPDFVWVWITILKYYPKYMERKVLLASPHLKVQNTPHIVRSTLDGLICDQLLQGDNTHENDTAPSPGLSPGEEEECSLQPGQCASVYNYTEPSRGMSSEVHFF